MNEAEYRQALLRIDELMDAQPGTPEVEELERLADLVVEYEERKFPISDPRKLLVNLSDLSKIMRLASSGFTALKLANKHTALRDISMELEKMGFDVLGDWDEKNTKAIMFEE